MGAITWATTYIAWATSQFTRLIANSLRRLGDGQIHPINFQLMFDSLKKVVMVTITHHILLTSCLNFHRKLFLLIFQYWPNTCRLLNDYGMAANRRRGGGPARGCCADLGGVINPLRQFSKHIMCHDFRPVILSIIANSQSHYKSNNLLHTRSWWLGFSKNNHFTPLRRRKINCFVPVHFFIHFIHFQIKQILVNAIKECLFQFPTQIS